MKRKHGDYTNDSLVSAESSKRRRKSKRTNEATVISSEQWNSASSVQNYMLNDPILDWLKLHKKPSIDKNSKGFFNFLMRKGNEFEDAVVEYIRNKFDDKDFIQISEGVEDIISVSKYRETVECMKKGIPIIYQGVLHNAKNKTYGCPDFIVRSDYLNELVLTRVIDDKSAYVRAPGIDQPYHYRIVDIKFCTLKLRADGEHLLNSGRNPCIKAQLLIYNTALGEVQGYTPPTCYVLGRGWNYTSKGEKYSGNRCDDKLGKIDVDGIDISYHSKIKDALAWRDRLKVEGSTWNVLPEPSVEELYPNMCNQYDAPYGKVKKELADQLDEITLLWMCGVKNRESCAQHGVTRWTDERCTVETLGMTGDIKAPTLERMLDFNHGKVAPNEDPEAKVVPRFINNNWYNWRGQNMNGGGRSDPTVNLEFFIDFENTTNILDDMQSLPAIGGSNIIFMVGLGYMTPDTKQWKYHCFVAPSLSQKGEFDMFKRFHTIVDAICRKYKCPDPNFYHWGHAETTLYNNMLDRQSRRGAQGWNPPKFCDFLRVMKDEIILVKGVLNFSLKSIGKGLHSHGLIDLTWDSGDCESGLDAMVKAGECYRKAKSRGSNVLADDTMQKIIKYNEVDCKMIYEIITYLRNNHSRKIAQGKTFKDIIVKGKAFIPPWISKKFGIE